jgi:long-chain acyl-CoA synthetase
MIDLTVGRSIRLAAEQSPDKQAVSDGSAALTHVALNAVSNQIANGLLALGLVKGDRVGVILPNCSLYVAVGCAIAKSGLVMTTLNYRFNSAEIAYQMADSGARALLFHHAFRKPAEQAIATLSNVVAISVGSRGDADTAGIDDLIAGASSDEPNIDVGEHDPYYLGYTSGTTGRPKGAIVTHRNRCLLYLHLAAEYGLSRHDVGLHAGPFHHTAPFALSMAQLCLGGSIAILPSFDARCRTVTGTTRKHPHCDCCFRVEPHCRHPSSMEF